MSRFLSSFRGGLLAGHRFVESNHLIGLRTFVSLHNVKFNFLAFLQAFVTLRLNGAVMDEHIGPFVTANKSKSLRIVKPLHDSLKLTHVNAPLSVQIGVVIFPQFLG